MELASVLALFTLIPSLAVHTVSELFHAFTWSVWAPAGAEAWALIEAPLTIVVAPLSSEYPIAATGCEEHVEALAVMLKGDGIEAALLGALMISVEVELLVVLPVLEAILIAILATQEAQLFPHDFTCSVCAPAEAATDAETVVLSTIAVLELLSSEKPMAVTACEEQ